VWASVGASVWASVGASVLDSGVDSVRDSVGHSGWDSVWDSVRDSVGASVRDSVGDSGYGQHDAPWLAFYDFFAEECGLRSQIRKLSGLQKISRAANWYLPHWKLVWISDRPELCCIADGRLHAEGGPALRYRDGWSIWSLHGVRVPQWLAETRDTVIDPQKFTEIDNAEIRREFVRKVGIDRIIYKCGAETVHSVGTYSLLRITVPGGRKWTYLKMLNPSVGLWHVEGVPNEIENVEAALNFRKPPELAALPIDDVNGADYYQQGDVCIWPREAKSVKRNPTILT